MLCYCYETENDFVLCVEDVNNHKLEEAILHAWYEKSGDRFIKTYPMKNMDNGVLENDKMVVKRNFAALGQAMFEGMLDCRWEEGLEAFADECNRNGIEWYIFGSISDVVRGIEVKPHDIDIFVHTKDFLN